MSVGNGQTNRFVTIATLARLTSGQHVCASIAASRQRQRPSLAVRKLKVNNFSRRKKISPQWVNTHCKV
jgi:hypothetical protein